MALQSHLARSVVRYLTESVDHPYCRLLSASTDGATGDILDIEVEPELAQDRRVPIRAQEPVRLQFVMGDDSVAPLVRALREDFPLGEVHTNFDRGADGLVLCVWEEGWHDLSRTLTGQMVVERIRAWFTLMASGKLHREDQPPEPLIPTSSHTIVIPPGILKGRWYIDRLFKDDDTYTLLMSDRQPVDLKPGSDFAVFHREVPSQLHRALAGRPYDLGALHAMLLTFGVNLISELREWLSKPEQTTRAADRQLLLIFTIPIRRNEEGPDEVLEVWAYTGGETLAAFGEKVGATFTLTQDGVSLTAPALMGPGPVELDTIPLPGWRVVQRLDRAMARVYAGRPQAEDAKLVAIGAGAIGSNVVMNTVRAGIGEWTVIDDDDVLPHNTVRQIQTNYSVGFPKAAVLEGEANTVLAQACVTGFVADVLCPRDRKSDLEEAVAACDLAVDFSASPAVLGYLADCTLRRAASLFFSPDGSDLVMLAEDRGRRLRIDEVEAQYFLTVAADARLDGHLRSARMDLIRYANACQDLSRPLPPWRVQMLSGLGAGRILGLLESERASADVWRLDAVSGGVKPVSIPLCAVQRFHTDHMRLSVSKLVLDMVRSLRERAAPNETGGVLLGTYDLVRGVVHVLAALPAPPDSRQSPTYFIRGKKDLQPEVERLGAMTAGRLQYVGEWHSHPDHAAARPSGDDEQVFGHLQAPLEPTGAPFAMMITGAADSWIRMGWAERGQVEGVLDHHAD